jgi:hypothetical protein
MEKLPAPLQITASAGSLSRSPTMISPRLTGPGTAVGVSVQARKSACAAAASPSQGTAFGGCKPSSAAAKAVGVALMARCAR